MSGGTLNRPAVQELLNDIKAGQVDTVVVYKVDRLTRSLNDFSRLMELFDKHNVSFVSVTQQFNTTSSMGRLTLNVLLSFAQFEREITGERIRDKIAASKKKGMWMGGLPPLGYDVKEKGLVINSTEAEIVRTIFALYLDLGSMSKVKKEVDRLMLRTKERNYGGKVTGGKPFSRGHLYHLIKNPLYAGQVRYKDEVFEGQHDAIIDHSMWLEAQSKLRAGNAQRISQTNQKHPNLLTGLIYDASGTLLSPHYSMKKDRRYRYYVSSNNLRTNIKGWRIAAPELENTIVEILVNWLEDRNQACRTFADIIEEHPETAEILIKNTRALSQKLRSNQPSEIRELISALIMRIEISISELDIALDKKQIIEKLGLSISIQDNEKSIHINSVHQIKRRGQERKIIIQGAQQSNKDLKLISLVSRSYRWLQDIKNGQVKTISEIAKIERMDDGDVSRFFQFAFLAPEIVTSILEGTQPADLTVEKLKRLGTLPLCWSEQKSRLGY